MRAVSTDAFPRHVVLEREVPHYNPADECRGNDGEQRNLEREGSQPRGRTEEHREMEQNPEVEEQHASPQIGAHALVAVVAVVEVAQKDCCAQGCDEQKR